MSAITSGIQLSIIVQCAVLIAFLIRARGSSGSMWFIVVLLVVFCSHMAVNLIITHAQYFRLIPLTYGFGLLYGPGIYLFTQSSIFESFTLRPAMLMHLIPAILITLTGYSLNLSAFDAAMMIFISLGIYIVLSARMYKTYRLTIIATQSLDDAISLHGIKVALIISAIILVFNIVSVLITVLSQNEYLISISQMIFFILLAMAMLCLALAELTKDSRFNGIESSDIELIQGQTIKSSAYEIDNKSRKILDENLMSLMKQKKPYLNPLFNLKQLARTLGVPQREVSAYINQEIKMNFSEFVNSYRLEDVKQQLCSDNKTILDIAFECGFSTKSNFNRAFKNQQGMTPSEYKRTLQEDNNN